MSLQKLMKRTGVTRVEEIQRYRLTTTTGETHLIDFIPVSGMPGFSHRVALDGELTATYLGAQFNPSQYTAVDMLDILHQKGQVKRKHIRLTVPGSGQSVLYKVVHETPNVIGVEAGVGDMRVTALLCKMIDGSYQNSAGQTYIEVKPQ